jgi:xanthine dehydrogenase YagT iron-sulfur-binding subunit
VSSNKSRKIDDRGFSPRDVGELKIIPDDYRNITRREFVVSAGAMAGAMAFGVPWLNPDSTAAEFRPDDDAPRGSAAAVKTTLIVNGKPHQLTLDPRVTLLDALRESIGLTGTKKGCDHGQCGACTVLANGRRINSCLALAVVHDRNEITTIEGLAHGDELHPVQSAFLECDGFQCGYCTSGQICSAVALLAEAKAGSASFATKNLNRIAPVDLTANEIRERMSGNICRCGAYPGIVQAVQKVYQKT